MSLGSRTFHRVSCMRIGLPVAFATAVACSHPSATSGGSTPTEAAAPSQREEEVSATPAQNTTAAPETSGPARDGRPALATSTSPLPVGAPTASDTAVSGCPLLEPVPSADVPGIRSAMMVFRVVGTGTCRIDQDDPRLFIAAPPSEPRRLGGLSATVLHPGDYLLLPSTPDRWISGPDLATALKEVKLEQMVNTRFRPIKGATPPGTRPLTDLKRVTGSVLELLGAFDYRDQRDSDGTVSYKALVRASMEGITTVKTVQHYERSRGGTKTAEGNEEQTFSVQVVSSQSPIASPFGVLSGDGQSIAMGVNDLWIMHIPLGYLNRGGTEERGPIGVMSASASR